MVSITKKNFTITVDEDLVKKAKKQIPNISKFVEDCLKCFLGMGNKQVSTSRQYELIQTISKCQLELHLMNEKSNIEKSRKEAETEEINLVWRKLYAEYRDTRKIDSAKLKEAEKILGVSSEELTDIIEVLFVYHNETEIDITDWFEVYNEYGYGD
ncbi:MAG: type II toxin-antitoxin system CcdA family antitoxin [Clostridia bacterium]|nr:type II toxin-antitoxin system CcdA family antitoxin [Clostridia bacterium]